MEFGEKIIGSPLMKSYETTPARSSFSFSQSEPVSSFQSPSNTETNRHTKKGHISKLGKKGNSYTFRIREHVKLGNKLSEVVKGKLRLGAKIIQEGGRQNIFKNIFGVVEGEKLLKASQCYLSTTAGPMSGLLFISSERVAFCSEHSIRLHSSSGELLRVPYKVVIPVRKIKIANRSENADNPAQKYIEIVTNDNFEFWFMGFLRYEKAFKSLEKAISVRNSAVSVA